MGVVDVGKALYNNTEVQDGLYKAAVCSPHNVFSCLVITGLYIYMLPLH